MFGNSRFEVLSALDLKDAFHSLRLFENAKRYCGILPYFGSTSYLYQRMPMELNISPSIWHSYINAILYCLQSRKYCEAIMADLLLLMPTKKSHMVIYEDLLKVLLKMGSGYPPRNVNSLEKSYNIWRILYLFRIGEYVLNHCKVDWKLFRK